MAFGFGPAGSSSSWIVLCHTSIVCAAVSTVAVRCPLYVACYCVVMQGDPPPPITMDSSFPSTFDQVHSTASG